MAAFKVPDFNERTAAAKQAKERALEQLRTKPAPDETVVAARQAAQEAREAALAEKSAAKRAAIEETKAAARAAAEAKAAAAEAEAEAARKPAITLPTQAELKAARDARYAARKERKR